MYSGTRPSALPLVGFPIRKSRGQRLVSTSPGLIAAAHVLLRLLAPRHPPCALILLIVKNSHSLLWSFQGARELGSPNERSPMLLSTGLSKLNSKRPVSERDCRGRRDLGDPRTRTARLQADGPIYVLGSLQW